MPKIQRKSLINLTAFRQRNNILQKELADYLDVSRGYISMIESGRSTIAKESLDKIYENPYHWNVEDLTPAFTRWNKAVDYANGTRNELRAAAGLPPCFITFLPEDLALEDQIKYGYSDIPEYIADRWCESVPELSREWLLTGQGEMLIEEDQDAPSPIEVLQGKIEQMEAELKDIKALIEQMSVSLPEKVVAALQAMSNK